MSAAPPIVDRILVPIVPYDFRPSFPTVASSHAFGCGADARSQVLAGLGRLIDKSLLEFDASTGRGGRGVVGFDGGER